MNVMERAKTTMVLSAVKASLKIQHKGKPKKMTVIYKEEIGEIFLMRKEFFDIEQITEKKDIKDTNFKSHVEKYIDQLKEAVIICDFENSVFSFEGVNKDGSDFKV